MSAGQMRVFVLLLILFVMEIAIQPAVKTAVLGAWNGINTALANIGKPATK